MTTSTINGSNTMALVRTGEPAPARGMQINTMSDLAAFGSMLAKSGYFKDAREAAQACVKVQAGIELGIPPVQAMTGIHIVEGKPTLSAALIATLVKRSGRYNYRIVKHDDSECSIAFFEGREQIGVSTFTYADAERAGVTKNGTWSKYRRNMLFARAMSNGARWHCPDIFGGPVYTPEELGVEVNGDGEPIKTVASTHVERDPPHDDFPDVDALKNAALEKCRALNVGSGTKEEVRNARIDLVTQLNGGKNPKTSEDWQRVNTALDERLADTTKPAREPGSDDDIEDPPAAG